MRLNTPPRGQAVNYDGDSYWMDRDRATRGISDALTGRTVVRVEYGGDGDANEALRLHFADGGSVAIRSWDYEHYSSGLYVFREDAETRRRSALRAQGARETARVDRLAREARNLAWKRKVDHMRATLPPAEFKAWMEYNAPTAVLNRALKDAWTSPRIAEQLYAANPLIEALGSDKTGEIAIRVEPGSIS
jgi:hypothetical protein